jgi:hypothetical protein
LNFLAELFRRAHQQGQRNKTGHRWSDCEHGEQPHGGIGEIADRAGMDKFPTSVTMPASADPKAVTSS